MTTPQLPWFARHLPGRVALYDRVGNWLGDVYDPRTADMIVAWSHIGTASVVAQTLREHNEARYVRENSGVRR